ncbi:unnamed protein product [Caenorhabditis sp. 36 PRJEB53466]|nr:unnamed protein product [Caenorhabditis sp. 36 PRJEB53466]
MIRVLLTAAALVAVVSSLQCESCDSFLSCNRPFPVNCPPHSKCYTLTKRHGQELLAKGCAHSCESLTHSDGAYCTTCHHRDFCNGPEPGIGQGVVMNHHPPEIGGGVAPDNGYHIGHGVRPRSATHSSFGFVLALPLFSRINL